MFYYYVVVLCFVKAQQCTLVLVLIRAGEAGCFREVAA